MTPIERVREALEYAGTVIKFHVKPEKCVTRGDIEAGTDVSRSALQVYQEIQEALRELEGMCIVPVEPTVAMGLAWNKAAMDCASYFSTAYYKAMIKPYIKDE